MTGRKYNTNDTKVVKKPFDVNNVIDLTDSDSDCDDAPTPTTHALPWKERVCGVLGYSAQEALDLLEGRVKDTFPDGFEVKDLLSRLHRPNHVKGDIECECSLCFPSLHEAAGDDDCPMCVSCHEDLDDDNSLVDEEGEALSWVPSELDGIQDLNTIFCKDCLKTAMMNGGFCHLCCEVLGSEGECERERTKIWNKV